MCYLNEGYEDADGNWVEPWWVSCNMEDDDRLYYTDENGDEHMHQIEPCYYCDDGTVECDCTGGMGKEYADFDCPACGGRGRVTCPVCHGRGYLIKSDDY